MVKAYQRRTGIAGYTLVYNSWGLLLATHDALASTEKAIEDELDTDPQLEIVERNDVRIRVEDTDRGQNIRQRIDELQALLAAYRTGLIKGE